MPMRRIPLAYESYQHQSLPLSSKRLLNMFAEQEPADARVPVALLPTPGLTVYRTVGAGPIQALNGEIPSIVYIGSGGSFYRITSGGATVTLGAIGSPATGIGTYTPTTTIAVSPTYCVVCVPPNAYYCLHGGTTLTQITDAAFPPVSCVAYFDGWFVFALNNTSGEYIISPLGTPVGPYDALQFAVIESAPAGLQRIELLNNDLWFFASSSVEVWYDAGQADFPFRRRAPAISHGSVSPRGIVKADSSLIWLSAENIVYRSNAYKADRISTHAVEKQIEALGSYPSDALSYVQNGHTFYSLSYPSETLVCDLATGKWHNRATPGDPGGRWRAAYAALDVQTPLLGDYAGSGLYTVNEVSGLDYGNPMTRQIVCPPIYPGTNRASMHRVEIEMEVGDGAAPASVTLDWSDDGGQTFTGGPRVIPIAGTGYRQRIYTTRLGSFRNRVLRLTASNLATIYAIDADIEELAA